MGKKPTCNAGEGRDRGSISGSGRSPGEGHSNPLQCFLPGESHGQRSLTGDNPWGCKESDTTEATEHSVQHNTLSSYLFPIQDSGENSLLHVVVMVPSHYFCLEQLPSLPHPTLFLLDFCLINDFKSLGQVIVQNDFQFTLVCLFLQD